MKQITTGDMLHAYGSFGLHMNYAVRLTVRLTDQIDGAILANALRKTQKRFPFLSVQGLGIDFIENSVIQPF